MPDAPNKKRPSPSTGGKLTKQLSTTENESITESAVESEEVNGINENVLVEEEPKIVEPPVDVMKNEPVLTSLIVKSYIGQTNENGFFHGEGTAYLKGDMVYEGSFKNGKMHGEGVFTWPNGTNFTGQFIENEIFGRGIHT